MNNILNKVYKAMEEKIAEDIVTIDMRSVNPYIDYFVICSANNYRKANAIAMNIFDMCDINDISYRPNRNEKDSLWQVCDLGNIVCHIFVNDERNKYNLEELWKDLPRINL